MMPRYVNKRDANDDEIATDLRKCGYRLRQAPVDAGFDYYVRKRGAVTVYLEIKTKLGRLTDNEEDFRGYVDDGPYVVARTTEEALAKIQQWI